MNKHNIFITMIFLMIGSALSGQQDAQFTQFIFNKLAYNPAYAGSQGGPAFTALHRKQWAGLEGAPSTQSVNFHLPVLDDRVGIGLSILSDKIGPTNSFAIGMSYSYRMELEEGVLSIGIKGSLRKYQVDWDNAITTHLNDALIDSPSNSKFLPNVGVGIYYETPTFYIGLSAPNIYEGDISLLDEFVNNFRITSLEKVHFYAMGSFLFDLTENVKLKPAILFKYVQNAPLDMDINISAILSNKIWVGVSYRLGGSTAQGIGESIDYILQYQFNDSFRAGMAFDFTLSELEKYSSGTYELLGSYYFSKKREKATNPRYF